MQRDGTGAEALHGKGEIGQPGMARQRLAQQADGARIDDVVLAAKGRASNGIAQPAGGAEARHEVAAGGVGVAVVLVADVVASPAFEIRRELAVFGIEEWPVQVAFVAHRCSLFDLKLFRRRRPKLPAR